MSNRSRIGLLVALVAVAAVTFFALRGGGGGGSSEPTTVSTGAVKATTPAFRVVAANLTVNSDGPIGGVKTITVRPGDRLVVKVRSKNFTGEVHFHGFDVHKDLTPGATAVFDISPKQTKDPKVQGVVDMELEQTSTLIARVQVSS